MLCRKRLILIRTGVICILNLTLNNTKIAKLGYCTVIKICLLNNERVPNKDERFGNRK